MVCRHAAWLLLGMGLVGCAANAAPVTLDAHVVAVAGSRCSALRCSTGRRRTT